MAVRLFVGNLSYSTTEADLARVLRHRRAAVAGRAAGRSGNRPPARLCVRRVHRAVARRAGDPAVQRPDVQRTAAGRQRSARARRSRTGRSAAGRPGGFAGRGRAGGGFGGPRPPVVFGGPPRPFDPSAPQPPREPQLRSRRQAAARRQRQGQEEGSGAAARPDPAQDHRPLVHPRRRRDSPDEALPDIDDFATSKPDADKELDDDKELDADKERTPKSRRRRVDADMSENVWQSVLERLRTALDPEEFRRWFAAPPTPATPAIRSPSGCIPNRFAATSSSITST